VAARENAISMKKMKAMNRQTDVLDMIKGDLLRASKRDESINLANYIQRYLASSLREGRRNVADLGVKQALFYVLFGARMPSVLAEVSFISNPEEEALLSKESYRNSIAEGIADGIHLYFTSSPVIQKTVLADEAIFYR
jgi:N-acetylmuramoyl-L-alanine amidase